ncbi:MAG: winged helix-turn-helix domain-containing protein [Acidobacteria bacterium]|nr:winged helix-turn-helix domain-containing protein [Acidobacteriota bacterium]
MSKPPDDLFVFGDFHLKANERLLQRRGVDVPLPPKVFDLLLVLVQNHGRVVDKEQLMNEVWPDTFVEENNLKVYISTLRKVLGESTEGQKYIETLPKRGYRFAADLTRLAAEDTELHGIKHTVAKIRIEEQEETSEPQPDHATQVAVVTVPVKRLATRRKLLVAVAALFILAVGVSLWLMVRAKSTTPPPALRSIAVLPFKPLSAEAKDEYLGPSLADALITRLSSLRQIAVRPSSATLKYEQPEQNPRLIGQQLQVDALLMGGVQKSGEHLRLTLQLVRVADGTTLWANTFDESLRDLFKVQDSISEQVTRALALVLTGDEKPLVVRHQTENAEAYQLLLKGRYFFTRRTEEGLKTALDYFQQAIDKDPNYALAYAELAEAFLVLSTPEGVESMPLSEGFPKAEAAATRALELDDTVPEAHVAMALVMLLHPTRFGAEREFKRALELNPDDSAARNYYANYLMVVGRTEEAKEQFRTALELDPSSLIINCNWGLILYRAGLYEQAIEQLQKTIAMDATFFRAHWVLGQVYEQKLMFEAAIAEFQQALALTDNQAQALAALSHAYAAAQQMKPARQALLELQALSARHYVSPYQFAIAYAGLGETNQAFAALEQGLQARQIRIALVRNDPRFDQLRGAPRYRDLYQRFPPVTPQPAR